ncbi:hypothetical protein F5880DRAFT_1755845, partial [Lentinula raphanica]
MAVRCPEGDKNTCGKCGENHNTTDCTSDKRHCINCGSDSHASSDRECPTFQQKCEALNKRSPINLLPFFPSNEEWTW